MPDPIDETFEARVTASFARQTLMHTLGATLEVVRAGEVHIRMPYGEHLTQQHGFVHAGVITSIVDSACGYAALTRMRPEVGVLSVEFKINLMAPARGDTFLAIGRVLRAGRTITVCTGEVHAFDGTESRVVAVMQATMMSVEERDGIAN